MPGVKRWESARERSEVPKYSGVEISFRRSGLNVDGERGCDDGEGEEDIFG